MFAIIKYRLDVNSICDFDSGVLSEDSAHRLVLYYVAVLDRSMH